VADDAERAYLLAQRKHLTAKLADAKERERVKECLDDIADREDAKRGKSRHPAP
jgi:hypothetical protein